MTQLLASEAARLSGTTLLDLFAQDGHRSARFGFEAAGLHLDLSRQRLDEAALSALLSHADAVGVPSRVAALLSGDLINSSEERPALHMAMRNTARSWLAGGVPVGESLAHEQARATVFAEGVRAGAIRAQNGERYRSILHLGVGGSDLGVRLVYDSLAPIGAAMTIRFAANIDPYDVAAATSGLDPSTTLVIAASKSFGTQETMANLAAVRAWFEATASAEAFQAQSVAVTANPARALAAGFAEERVFGFPEWVGGRYSVWSSVCLALEVVLGPATIADFRAGAASLDRHFETAPLATNLPVLAALTGYWNRSILGHTSRATVPYASRLRLLPAYLQQLDMESNGKSVGPDGEPVPHLTSPVVWGAEGTNGQHAFFQQLHQGPEPVPVDFILPWTSRDGRQDAHNALVSHALAQAEALLVGRSADSFMEEHMARGMAEADARLLAAQRACPGNRPSTIVSFTQLDAGTLGALLAFFEHRTFVEGVLWGVNPYDQWGVELGKVLAKQVDAAMAGDISNVHPSTASALNRWRAVQQS